MRFEKGSRILRANRRATYTEPVGSLRWLRSRSLIERPRHVLVAAIQIMNVLHRRLDGGMAGEALDDVNGRSRLGQLRVKAVAK